MPSQLIQLPTDVTLELDLSEPRGHREGETKLALCLHPWSWLGGQMNDPVLLALATHLQEDDYFILRYNSRGVGKSTGWASFTGFSEAKDLEAVVQWALGRIPDISSVVLIGYSHGSLITSLHPVLPPPIKTSHILISYPLGPRSWLTLFNANTYARKLKDLISHASANVLILHGDEDEFTSSSNYAEWMEELKQIDREAHLRVMMIPHASHFWRGRAGQELGGAVQAWLQTK